MDWHKIRGLANKFIMAAVIGGGAVLSVQLKNGVPMDKAGWQSLGFAVGVGAAHAAKNWIGQFLLPSILPPEVLHALGINPPK